MSLLLVRWSRLALVLLLPLLAVHAKEGWALESGARARARVGAGVGGRCPTPALTGAVTPARGPTPAPTRASAPCPSPTDALSHRLDELVAPVAEHAAVGLCVRSLDRGDELYARNADAAFVPASNQKLLVAA